MAAPEIADRVSRPTKAPQSSDSAIFITTSGYKMAKSGYGPFPVYCQAWVAAIWSVRFLPTATGRTVAQLHRRSGDRFITTLGGWGSDLSPAILAVLFVWVSRRGTRFIRRDSMEVMGIAGVFTVLGFWVAGARFSCSTMASWCMSHSGYLVAAHVGDASNARGARAGALVLVRSNLMLALGSTRRLGQNTPGRSVRTSVSLVKQTASRVSFSRNSADYIRGTSH